MEQRSKMLSPEKWHSIFDSDGRVIAFRKALKSIILGVSLSPVAFHMISCNVLGCRKIYVDNASYQLV